MSNLISLPRDLLILSLSQLDLVSLARICTSSSQLNSICQSRDFWAFKYVSEFHEPFPVASEAPPRVIYLRKKQAILIAQLRQAKLARARISDILVSAAIETDKNKMKLITGNYLETLDALGVEGAIGEDLRELLEDYNIQINGQIEELAREIIQIETIYLSQVREINRELDFLFAALSIFKIPHRYMTFAENMAFNTFKWRMVNRQVSLPPVRIDQGKIPPMPANLPPPPSRAPLLSLTSEPRPLPDDFPPPYPPVSPGTVFPAELSGIQIPPPVPPPVPYGLMFPRPAQHRLPSSP